MKQFLDLRFRKSMKDPYGEEEFQFYNQMKQLNRG
jgi:hypothetical protein